MERTEWEPAPWTVRLVQQRLKALGTPVDEATARELARDVLRLEGTRLDLIARGAAIEGLREAEAAVQRALAGLEADGAAQSVSPQPAAPPAAAAEPVDEAPPPDLATIVRERLGEEPDAPERPAASLFGARRGIARRGAANDTSGDDLLSSDPELEERRPVFRGRRRR